MVRNKKALSGLVLAFLMLVFSTSTYIKADEWDYVYDPVVMVSSYKVTNDSVTPGETFELTIELENTHASAPAQEILLNISCPDGISTVYPTMTQVYLDGLEPKAKEKVTFELEASPYYNRSLVTIGVNIATITRNNYVNLYIPVLLDSSSFKVVSKSIPEEAYAGKKISASLTFKSMIDEKLGNVSFKAYVDDSENPVISTNLGNLSAGASMSQNASFSINEKGSHSVRFEITYTTAEGEELTSELYSGTIEVVDPPAVTEAPVQTVQDQAMSANDKSLIIGCIGASLVLFIGIILIAKKYN